MPTGLVSLDPSQYVKVSDGDLGEELQLLVQDDLTNAQLLKVRMVAQGHELQENF